MNGSGHDLYRNGDADAPSSIKDGNGEVVLGLCRICGRGEVELSEGCVTIEQAARPTQALPGSSDKLAILTARASFGLPLFVEGDANYHRPSLYRSCNRVIGLILGKE